MLTYPHYGSWCLDCRNQNWKIEQKRLKKETTSEKRKTEEKSNPDGSINFIHHFSLSKKITEEKIHLSLPHRNMKLVPVTYFLRFSSFSLIGSLWLPQRASIVFMQWTFFAAHQVNENQSSGLAFPRRSHREKILPHSKRRRILFYGDIMT